MSILILVLAVAGAQAPAAQVPMNLACGGAGTANKRTAQSAFTNGFASGMVGNTPISGSGSATTTIYGTRQEGFVDQVDIRLFSGDDRIRMPRTMLPAIHGGSDGWFKLKNVVADARSIHASVAVSLLNNPKLYIDRVTGTISISGKSGDYAGQCELLQADAPAKF
jgi:hypothetical protein